MATNRAQSFTCEFAEYNFQVTQPGKCVNSEFLWSVFHIWTKYGDLQCESLYGAYMRKNKDHRKLRI